MGGGLRYLADDVDVATDRRDFVLHDTNLLEKLMHVLALGRAAALKICFGNGL